MSDRGTSETIQIALGLEENDDSPWEYGTYIERKDGDDWVPLVYSGRDSYDDARDAWLQDCRLAASAPGLYRNPRIVRRAVSPWELIDR